MGGAVLLTRVFEKRPEERHFGVVAGDGLGELCLGRRVRIRRAW